MSVRSEYRRRYDSKAAATQDALEEIEAERRGDVQRIARRAQEQQEQEQEQQQRANGVPPWQGELDDYDHLRQASRVSAPPSRNAGAYSYVPAQRPESMRLSAEEMEVCRKCDISPVDYARHKLKMEAMKASGDLQQ